MTIAYRLNCTAGPAVDLSELLPFLGELTVSLLLADLLHYFAN